MKTTIAVLGFACAFGGAVAAAQDTPFVTQGGGRPVLEPDGTYVFNHIPNSSLVFEGQIAPRIIVKDSIGDATRTLLASGRRPVWGWQLSATPMVKLRMFKEASSPVRTPSYMPKGTIQVARLRNVSSADESNEAEFSRGPVEIWLLDAIPFGHHSNGQNGCLFTLQRRNAAGDCLPLDPSAPLVVNKTDGSFSTNYLEAIVQYGRMYLDSEGAPETEFATRWEWRMGGGLQLNPDGYLGGSIDEELADLYGQTRVIVEGMTARRGYWRCGRVDAGLRLQYMTSAPSGLPAWITDVEGACLPAGWGGTGLFIRLHHGQDYYNLGFAESITRLQFGVTMQRGSFLSFRIRPL